jgi:uncharacterized membrane protein (UPF0127 family)
MPNNVSAKIKLALSLRVISVILFLSCLLLTSLIYLDAVHTNGWRTLSLRDEKFKLEVADTPARQAQGLGGRSLLPANQGMLFAFHDDAARCFWMKDTQVMLDMIWLDSSQKVLHVESDVDPATFPEQFCAQNKPARYVIEVNANVAQSYGVEVGERLHF